MKQSNVWRTLLFNWPVKVFSLLLATLIVVVINFISIDTREVEIPLVVLLPQEYEAASQVDSTVTLSIRADGRYLALIDPASVTATADFSFVNKEGVATTPILLTQGESLFNIKATLTTKPEIARVYFTIKRSGSGD